MFSIGDVVTWTSQSAGTRKEKTGTVIAVVPACVGPYKFVKWPHRLRSDGLVRNHESYLVQVGRSNNLYWPRVSQLRHAGQ
jgi:hypothetical protein